MNRRETITITLQDESEVEVILRNSNIGDAAYHTQLILSGEGMKYNISQTDDNKKSVGTFLYPHCVACVDSPESVREMSLDDFILLDELELNKWAAASDRLNHHWWQAQTDYVKSALLKMKEMSDEAQKKIGTPSPGSPPSTTVPTPKTKVSRRSRK